MFRIKPHTSQRHSEGSNKPVHTMTQRPHRDLDGIMFECSPVEVWVSSGLLQGQGLWVQ